MKHLSKIALAKRNYFFLELTAPRCVRCGILCMTSICIYCQIDIDEGLEWPWLGKMQKSKIIAGPASGTTPRGGSLRRNSKFGHRNRREVPRCERHLVSQAAASGEGSSRGIGRSRPVKNRDSDRRRSR